MPDKYDISSYLQGVGNNAPICREERQYTALLYTAFLAVKNGCHSTMAAEIARKCLGIPDRDSSLDIKEVYFESTLMRDSFNQYNDSEKESFNNALLGYCATRMKEASDSSSADKIVHALENTDLEGRRKALHRNLSQRFFSITPDTKSVSLRNQYPILKHASKMMASKPDLAVLYCLDRMPHLVMLECKYLSPIRSYSGDTQIVIQHDICKFLCEYVLNNGGNEIKPENTRLIRFYNHTKKHFRQPCTPQMPEMQKSTDGDPIVVYISISDMLCMYNNKMRADGEQA